MVFVYRGSLAIHSPHSATAALRGRKLWLQASIFLFAALAVVCIQTVDRPAPIDFSLEISSTVTSTAEFYFNRGQGYNETDAVRLPIEGKGAAQFQSLHFRTAVPKLKELRFDPATAPGTFEIRDVRVSLPGRTIEIPATDLQPFNQIASIKVSGNRAVVVSAEHGDDPGLRIGDRSRRQVNRGIVAWRTRVILRNEFWLIFVVAGLLFAATSLGRYQGVRAKYERALSATENEKAVAFLLACGAFFLLMAAADLNGSSMGCYVARHGGTLHVLLGEPREIRSDEWAYVSPDIFNQIFKEHPFSSEQTAFGDHDVALLGGNIPVRDIAEIFRPQFWAFFVLPPDYAYALYWQCKGLLLVSGVFAWLFLITHSAKYSALGSLWYFFSQGIQWSYSWPSELPEMIGLTCLLMVSVCLLLRPARTQVLLLASIGIVFSALDLALCFYVPHLVPLAWLAFLFLLFWSIANRNAILTNDRAALRLVLGGLCLVIIAIVGLRVYREARVAFAGISNTNYPGKRVIQSGTWNPVILMTDLMPWAETEGHVPAVSQNICEGTGFLWLAPLTLFIRRRDKLDRVERAVWVALWCAAGLLLLWLFGPIPAGFAKWSLLDKTFGARCVLALGLANVGLVMLALRKFSGTSETHEIRWRSRFQRWAGEFLAFLSLLAAVNAGTDRFFSATALCLSALLLVFFCECVIEGRGTFLSLTLVALNAYAFGLANPVQKGTAVLTDSTLARYVRSHRQLLRGKWIVFSPDYEDTGFVAATGLNVYTGTRFLPDIDHFSMFAQAGQDVQAMNNLGFLIAIPLGPNGHSEFHMNPFAPIITWQVSPLDPLLRKAGITYAAFANQPPEDVRRNLQPVSAIPLNGYWLYRLP